MADEYTITTRMPTLPLLPIFIALVLGMVQPAPEVQWSSLTTGVTARLRGVSAVNDQVVWASGTSGTVIRTADGGKTWRTLTVPSAEKLDFRDVDAIDERTAFVLSIGPGEQSRIFKTGDAGANWVEQFVNRDPKAFFEARAVWDAKRGVAVSVSVDGQFVILTTGDGGTTWTRVPASALPPALPNEGFFAASGTNVAVLPPSDVWIGTGAASEARVLHSPDSGRTWSLAKTPLTSGPSAGIFSIAFADAKHGIVVGGDYKAESAVSDNAAITADGGATWTLVQGLSGFRSVVAYQPRSRSSVVAVGPSGADVSRDGGKTWRAAGGPGFHAFSFSPSGTRGFAVGERGSAAILGVRP